MLDQDARSGFQDNDSLARELARELNADLLVLLTNVDGLLDGDPRDRTSKYAFQSHCLPRATRKLPGAGPLELAASCLTPSPAASNTASNTPAKKMP